MNDFPWYGKSGQLFMTFTPEMIRQLKGDEGFSAKPYKDSRGFLTIGYGTNIDVGISEKEAEWLLFGRLRPAQEAVYRFLPWATKLDDARLGVLVNMAYNMGINKLLEFDRTLAAIEAGKWEEAACAMESSLWYKQVGQRAVRLCKQMRTGEWVYANPK